MSAVTREPGRDMETRGPARLTRTSRARPGIASPMLASMILAATLAVISAPLAACGPTGPATFRRPNLRTGQRSLTFEQRGHLFTTDAGIRVLILPERNTNLVEVDVRYTVGASSDPVGKEGVSHMVEHLLFELRPGGSESPKIGQQLAQLAVYQNAYTTWDEVHFTSIGHDEHLAAMLALEARRMVAGRCAWLSEADFVREREVVRNEIRQRASVGRTLDELVRQAIYPDGHPYRRSVGGSDESVASLVRDDACVHMERYFVPAAAILVVSGNLDVERTKTMIGQILGQVKGRGAAHSVPVPTLSLSGSTSSHDLAVEETTGHILFPYATWGQGSWQHDRLYRELLESFLYHLLRERDDITDVDVGVMGGIRARAMVASISVTERSKLDGAIAAFFSEQKEFFSDLNRERVVALREERRQWLVESVESFTRRANIFADYLQYTSHGDFRIHDLRALDATQATTILAGVRQRFARSRSHIARVYPASDGVPREERAAFDFSRQGVLTNQRENAAEAAEAEKPLPEPDREIDTLVQRFELPNGLRVIFVPSLKHSMADIRLIFPVGSRHEPAERPGLATQAASMLGYDLSRPFLPVDHSIVTYVRSLGLEVDTRANELATVFRIRGLSMYDDAMLWQLHWLLESGVYNQKTVKRIKAIYARQRESEDAREIRRRRKAWNEALYGPGHPYARVSSEAEQVAAMDIAAMKRFRRDHYRIRGATLIVSGEFDRVAMYPEIVRLFGAWSGDRVVPEAAPVPAARSRSGYLASFDDDALQVDFHIGWTTPAGYRRDRAAWLVLRAAIEQAMSGLRDELGVTYGLYVTQQVREGPGELVVLGEVDRLRAAEAFGEIQATLERMRQGEFASEFVQARRKVLKALLADSFTSATVAGELEAIAIHGLAPDHFDKLAKQVAALVLADVQALARTALVKDSEVVLITGPTGVVKGLLDARGVTDYQVVE